MKTLIVFIVFLCCLVSGSFSLQCYYGNSSDFKGLTCPGYISDFCAIFKFKSGTFDNCGQEICTDLSCTDNEFCKEPGIFKQEYSGMKFEIDCCEKDLCNIENLESSAQRMNTINTCIYFFLLAFVVLFCFLA